MEVMIVGGGSRVAMGRRWKKTGYEKEKKWMWVLLGSWYHIKERNNDEH